MIKKEKHCRLEKRTRIFRSYQLSRKKKKKSNSDKKIPGADKRRKTSLEVEHTRNKLHLRRRDKFLILATVKEKKNIRICQYSSIEFVLPLPPAFVAG